MLQCLQCILKDNTTYIKLAVKFYENKKKRICESLLITNQRILDAKARQFTEDFFLFRD